MKTNLILVKQQSEILDIFVDKSMFTKLIYEKVKSFISYNDVFAVIDILFDEIKKEIYTNLQFKIKNFMTIKLNDLKEKEYFDIKQKKMLKAKSYKIMRIVLNDKIKRKLLDQVDIDRTFGDA